MANTKKQIIDVIADFLRKDSKDINETTSLKMSSVLKHRLYAILSDKGFHVRDKHEVKTIEDLLLRVKKKINDHMILEELKTTKALANKETEPVFTDFSQKVSALGIDIQMGVDIEEVDNFPQTLNFREDPFYIQTFSSREIAYCLLNENPIQSFAGKFAAKEAIIKVDETYTQRPMNQIEILNDKTGKPYFKDFRISISHTGRNAIAVAIKPSIVTLDHPINIVKT